MQRILLVCRRALVFAALSGAAVAAACSGGGSSSPAPSPAAPLGGIGQNIVLDERVNFTVIVPPTTTTSAVAGARHKRTAGTPATVSPYVSPKTASVLLQIATVNGQNLRTQPAPVVVNIACPTTAGCAVPIQNVPAAKGSDRFSVQTFSASGGTGNTISSGFVDVTVPSAQATSFGGTALTIGGFVQSISLALNVPGGAFSWHNPGTGTIDVNAIDPAGAIIIGSDQLANPIQVSLPDTNGGAFSLNGLQQLTLQQPARTITLAYNGSVLFAGTVRASTTDENSQPVATSVPVPLQAPPTPTPEPVPSSKPPLSLYVYDAGADRIIEYAGVNGVEGGRPFNIVPRRIFEVAADPSLNLQCNPSGSPELESIAVSTNGTIYAQAYCSDSTFSNQYTFTYSASTHETIPAQGTPAPPIPATSFSVSLPFAFPEGVKLDEAHNTVFLQYGGNSAVGAGGIVFGLPIINLANPTTSFGSTCLQELGENSCTANPASAYAGSPFNFAVDGNGFLYIPNSYTPCCDDNNNPITPPGAPTQAVPGEPAVLVYSPGLVNPAPNPLSALAGFGDELGTTEPPVIAIEGTTLYVLAVPGQIQVPGNDPNNIVEAGLSGCPPPSNPTPDTATNSCADTGHHLYVAGFPNATQTLTGASNGGTNVFAPPTFMLGGDVVGGFGDGNSTPGDLLAVRDGFAFVLNFTPPSGGAPEIDVYNVNNVSGFHTDTAPLARLVLDPSIVPTTIAVGPTGTGTGGAALLRRPARVHHDIRAWIRTMQQRRSAQHGHVRF
jgi:hypothetical protein